MARSPLAWAFGGRVCDKGFCFFEARVAAPRWQPEEVKSLSNWELRQTMLDATWQMAVA